MDMRLVNPDSPPEPLTEAARDRLRDLARRQARAGGLLMRGVNFVGGSVEGTLRALPSPLRAALDGAAEAALLAAYDAAATTRAGGRFATGRLGPLARRLAGGRSHRALAAASGAAGGFGGLATSVAELPLAVTIIFRAVQEVAERHGEDPASPETRLECLRVFGAGGNAEAGETGVDTSFLGARLTITGAAVQRLVARVAPRFAAVFGQKLAGQAVPLLGAVAGAGVNLAFIGYYLEVAEVHFGLRRLARVHGEAAVEEFHRALAAERGPVVPVKRA